MKPIYPYGSPTVHEPSHSSGNYAIDPVDDTLIVVENQTALTGDMTLDLANLEDLLPEGSEIWFKTAASGSSRAVNPGSNLSGLAATVNAGETNVVTVRKLKSGFYIVANDRVA